MKKIIAHLLSAILFIGVLGLVCSLVFIVMGADDGTIRTLLYVSAPVVAIGAIAFACSPKLRRYYTVE